jgi:squalene/oxidosqualene cyclase-like protein
MNPSEVFGDIMIDYSYVECSSACMTALAAFRRSYQTHRAEEIAIALSRGARFIRGIQRADGSWYGSWGVCFTYATWFGIEALTAAGVPPQDSSIRRAVAFVLSKQNDNGGWGESYRSCVDKHYDGAQRSSYGAGGSGVVQTAWALLALMSAAVSSDNEVQAVERGVRFLMSQQLPSGDFPQEGITGVFNRSCGITYTSYRNTFPIWALGKHREWKAHIAH